jgi:hypothetical protein
MKDMLGQSIAPGDIFTIAGGNARFGGLVIEVGIVISNTEKMLKTYVTRFDKIKLKPLNKTPRKVLKITDPSSVFLKNESVQELLKVYQTHLDFNSP